MEIEAETSTALIISSGGHYQLTKAATPEALGSWIIQHNAEQHAPQVVPVSPLTLAALLLALVAGYYVGRALAKGPQA